MKQEQIIKVASDFKYWLDIQSPGKLFHPSGDDVRKSDAYKKASKLLLEASSNLAQGTQSPNEVLLIIMPVGNIISKNCTNAPFSAKDIFTKVRELLLAFGIKVSEERSSSSIDCCFFNLRDSGDSQSS